MRCGVDVGRIGVAVGAGGRVDVAVARTGALVAVARSGVLVAVAGGGGSGVAVGSRVGEDSGVGAGGTTAGSSITGGGGVGVAAAASCAALTMTLAPSRYIAVEKTKRTMASDAAAAPRLLSPSYQPHPWWTMPGSRGCDRKTPLRRRHRANRAICDCHAARNPPISPRSPACGAPARFPDGGRCRGLGRAAARGCHSAPPSPSGPRGSGPRL